MIRITGEELKNEHRDTAKGWLDTIKGILDSLNTTPDTKQETDTKKEDIIEEKNDITKNIKSKGNNYEGMSELLSDDEWSEKMYNL
jgi:hypothetical protein